MHKLATLVLSLGISAATWIVAPHSASATVVQLDYYSATGFDSGVLAGEPVHFVITLDGNTGSADGFSAQSTFSNLQTTASLLVGTTQVLSVDLNSTVFLAVDEGLNYIESTIAGVHTVFSSAAIDGPVVLSPLPSIATPSVIDQYLLLGIFFPQAFVPSSCCVVFSFIAHGGEVAELSSLTVSEVPLPAALPLYATGLGLMALFGWWKRRRAAAA